MTRFLALLLLPILASAEYLDLTDTQGRTIKAEVVSVDTGYVNIQKPDGRRYSIHIDTLDKESQDKVWKSVIDARKKETFLSKAPDGEGGSGLKVQFEFNGPPPASVEIDFFNSDTRDKQTRIVSPEATSVDLSGLQDGSYTISFEAEGYAHQWYRAGINNGKSSPDLFKVDFKKKRYVIMRYAINLNQKPDFDKGNIYTGVAAFSDLKYGNPQHYLGWRIRQADLGEKRFGDDFILQFKWMTPDNGVCIHKGDFERITSASGDVFTRNEVKLEPGVVFTSKSTYSRNPNMYGKFEVVDVVDEPDPGMDVY